MHCGCAPHMRRPQHRAGSRQSRPAGPAGAPACRPLICETPAHRARPCRAGQSLMRTRSCACWTVDNVRTLRSLRAPESLGAGAHPVQNGLLEGASSEHKACFHAYTAARGFGVLTRTSGVSAVTLQRADARCICRSRLRLARCCTDATPSALSRTWPCTSAATHDRSPA